MDMLRLMKNIYNHDLTPAEACNLAQEEIEAAEERGKAEGRAEAIAEIIEQQVSDKAASDAGRLEEVQG